MDSMKRQKCPWILRCTFLLHCLFYRGVQTKSFRCNCCYLQAKPDSCTGMLDDDNRRIERTVGPETAAQQVDCTPAAAELIIRSETFVFFFLLKYIPQCLCKVKPLVKVGLCFQLLSLNIHTLFTWKHFVLFVRHFIH